MSIKWPGCNFVVFFRFLTHDTMLCPFLETLPVPLELSVISDSQFPKVSSVCAKRTVAQFEESWRNRLFFNLRMTLSEEALRSKLQVPACSCWHSGQVVLISLGLHFSACKMKAAMITNFFASQGCAVHLFIVSSCIPSHKYLY